MTSRPNTSRAALRAAEIRRIATEVGAVTGQAYICQALGTADMLAAVFEHGMRQDGDRFVLSPGHYGLALYAAQAHLYDRAELDTYGQDGSEFEQSPLEGLPGVEVTGGSLGQGLSQAVGIALGQRLRGIDGMVWCLLSDGEMQEGQIWEALMAAGHRKLSNLTILVDRNRMQVDGITGEVMDLEPLATKLTAFGFDTVELDGHDLSALETQVQASLSGGPRPRAIVCDTTLGKGVPVFETDDYPHYICEGPEVWQAALDHLKSVAPEGMPE